MTTIVYDHKNKQLAIDGRITANDIILTDSKIKWRRCEDDNLWFFTGSCSDELELMELKHNDKPEVKPDCSALIIKDSSCWLATFNGDYCSHAELNYSHSIGTGRKFALSALDFGATARESVQHAAKRDIYTGGDIHVFCVETGKQISNPILGK